MNSFRDRAKALRTVRLVPIDSRQLTPCNACMFYTWYWYRRIDTNIKLRRYITNYSISRISGRSCVNLRPTSTCSGASFSDY